MVKIGINTRNRPNTLIVKDFNQTEKKRQFSILTLLQMPLHTKSPKCYYHIKVKTDINSRVILMRLPSTFDVILWSDEASNRKIPASLADLVGLQSDVCVLAFGKYVIFCCHAETIQWFEDKERFNG